VALGRLADDVFGGLEARQAAGLRSGQSLLSTLCVADGSAERREEARRFFCFGLFWHALDIVWIGVFTIVYLGAR
jgi:apolipoprotein N-acyltransferase